MSDVLQRLAAVLESRKSAAPDTSYTASLYAKGLDTILKKIGEESTELVIAGKAQDEAQIVYESADVIYHMMVLLVQQGIEPEQVLKELESRFAQSGLEEKASRTG